LEERPLSTRRELYIQYIESEYFEDLSVWFTDEVRTRYAETLAAKRRNETGAVASAAASPPAADASAADASDTASDSDSASGAGQDSTDALSADAAEDLLADVGSGPSGSGWVIEVKVLHFHNDSAHPPTAAEYVRREFVAKLVDGTVDLPSSADGSQTEPYTFQELGIQYPIIYYDEPPENVLIPDPNYEPERDSTPTVGLGAFAGVDRANDPKAFIKALGCECIVQFCWQPTRRSEREKNRIEQSEASEGGSTASMDE
jgi:hypothetical protein